MSNLMDKWFRKMNERFSDKEKKKKKKNRKVRKIYGGRRQTG